MNGTIADERVNFFINNTNVFNKLVESMTRNTNMYMAKITRSDVKKAFSCKNTQFLFVSLCYIENQYVNDFILNYEQIPKKSLMFENIVQQIGTYFSNLFYNLKPSPNPIKNTIAQFNELTELTNVYQIYHNLFGNKSSYDTGKYIICPLCLYTTDNDTNENIIEHYFTLIYDKENNKYYINSSYGDDKICVINNTNEIEEEYLTSVLNIFETGIMNEDVNIYNNILKFVKYYFLPNISDRLVNEQMNNLRRSKIGIINRYFNILDTSMQSGGNKKYKKNKSYKKRNSYKNRKSFKKYGMRSKSRRNKFSR